MTWPINRPGWVLILPCRVSFLFCRLYFLPCRGFFPALQVLSCPAGFFICAAGGSFLPARFFSWPTGLSFLPCRVSFLACRGFVSCMVSFFLCRGFLPALQGYDFYPEEGACLLPCRGFFPALQGLLSTLRKVLVALPLFDPREVSFRPFHPRQASASTCGNFYFTLPGFLVYPAGVLCQLCSGSLQSLRRFRFSPARFLCPAGVSFLPCRVSFLPCWRSNLLS